MTRGRRPAAALAAVVAAVVLAVVASLAPAGPATAARGGPAPVKVTLKQSLAGRVVSDRAACVKGRDVYLFGRAASGAVSPFARATSDDRGHFQFGARRGIQPSELFALVLGDARCRVAQSPDVDAPTRVPASARRALASRHITLATRTGSFTGRVRSSRQRCVAGVPVEIFGRSQGGSWLPLSTTTTADDGQYGTNRRVQRGQRGQRGQLDEFVAVALGDDTCRVAQSAVRTFN